MRYDELEAEIRRLVTGAGDESLRVFGAETVERMVRAEDLLTEDELDEDAAAALAVACDRARTAGAAELRALLTRIDDGILSDGDMDPALLTVVSALEHLTTYRETGRRDEIYELAIRSIEQVDHQVSAALDDFLATPEMAAEYERIRRLLTA
ncbi:hypothetical protein O7602_19395 [Micromonospora sp. WMMD1128]|uniref:hypothetical protein n=1 Tax=Micromonospora sp. WMMD1128 TaxID=3015150 RepID=UPI00248AE391|nr:hypothetical protein [Micromonospora sp. WMMD1128]WBB71895.1 hypothetical protein O7602_19395 [Micromonospora sp. WMMD1128]